MKRFAFVLVAAAVLMAAVDGREVKTASAVMELPPMPIDPAFEKAQTVKELQDALLDDAVFKKALAAAIAEKKAVEADRKKNPDKVGPSPKAAARQKFLEVLQGTEGKGEEK